MSERQVNHFIPAFESYLCSVEDEIDCDLMGTVALYVCIWCSETQRWKGMVLTENTHPLYFHYISPMSSASSAAGVTLPEKRITNLDNEAMPAPLPPSAAVALPQAVIEEADVSVDLATVREFIRMLITTSRSILTYERIDLEADMDADYWAVNRGSYVRSLCGLFRLSRAQRLRLVELPPLLQSIALQNHEARYLSVLKRTFPPIQHVTNPNNDN